MRTFFSHLFWTTVLFLLLHLTAVLVLLIARPDASFDEAGAALALPLLVVAAVVVRLAQLHGMLPWQRRRTDDSEADRTP